MKPIHWTTKQPSLNSGNIMILWWFGILASTYFYSMPLIFDIQTKPTRYPRSGINAHFLVWCILMMSCDHNHNVSAQTCYLTTQYREGPIHISLSSGGTNPSFESLGFPHLQIHLTLNLFNTQSEGGWDQSMPSDMSYHNILMVKGLIHN
jgi:hypothetical protein